MRYFALTEDGIIDDLGIHGDFDSADEKAGRHAIWIVDEIEARHWAEYIIITLKETGCELPTLETGETKCI